MDLPLYELKIDEERESWVDAIALVNQPAIESNFLLFSKEEKDLTFSLNDERKELIGAAMIPDMKIFRKDKTGKQYNVFFTAETIRKVAQVFFKKGFQNNINLNHTDTSADSYVFQSYIVDSENGLNSPKGLNLPDGSWVVGMKITSDETWNKVKSGEQRGFSVEGLFELLESKNEALSNTYNEDERKIMEYLKVIQKHLESKNKKQ